MAGSAKRERVAWTGSVAVSLLLGAWLVVQMLPETRKPVEDKPKAVAETQPLTEEKKQEAEKPMPQVVVLPAPPAATPTPVPAEAPQVAEAKPEPVPQIRPEPKPAPKPIVKPVAKPLPKPMPKPAPKPVVKTVKKAKPAPTPVENTVTLATVGREAVREGRTLLRILEHGAGPTIEIAWPRSQREKEQLFDRLTRCYGMRTALLDGSNGLFVDKGERGRPWALNLDRFSGFLRQPSGALMAGERSDVKRIRRHHGGLTSAVPVRLFPREVDALLLGGISRLVGTGYSDAKSIRAYYRAAGKQTYIENLSVDGRAIAGSIDLTGVGRRCSRRA